MGELGCMICPMGIKDAYDLNHCVGPCCMAWQWLDEADGGRGYCGLVGKPEVGDVSHTPDLLAATEAWVAAMKGWLDGNPPKSPEESRAIYDAAVAALKKARGEA